MEFPYENKGMKAVIASVSEAIHFATERKDGWLRRFAPRNDGKTTTPTA
jgi:hypothetical protein